MTDRPAHILQPSLAALLVVALSAAMFLLAGQNVSGPPARQRPVAKASPAVGPPRRARPLESSVVDSRRLPVGRNENSRFVLPANGTWTLLTAYPLEYPIDQQAPRRLPETNVRKLPEVLGPALFPGGPARPLESRIVKRPEIAGQVFLPPAVAEGLSNRGLSLEESTYPADAFCRKLPEVHAAGDHAPLVPLPPTDSHVVACSPQIVLYPPSAAPHRADGGPMLANPEFLHDAPLSLNPEVEHDVPLLPSAEVAGQYPQTDPYPLTEASGPQTGPYPQTDAPSLQVDASHVQADVPSASSEGKASVSASATPLVGSSGRSWNTELIAREADNHTQRGFELAGRGAYFSARSEFIVALRLVAQALDTERQTATHSRALASGLTALKEAEDFLPTGSRLEADLDLPDIVHRHRTPILKDAPTETLTPLVALRGYSTFAQEQLGASAGGEMAASMALYGLGKLHRTIVERQITSIRVARPKAMVFYQAALLVTARNFMASNDLGVLLAESGRYEGARIALQHSVSIYPSTAGWHNLAQVYRRLGHRELAQHAHQQWVALQEAEAPRSGRNRPTSGQPIRWVDPGTFTRSYPQISGFRQAGLPHSETRGQRIEPAGPVVVNDSAEKAAVLPATVFGNPQLGELTGKPLSDRLPEIQLCQALGPAAAHNICGVDCAQSDRCGCGGWESIRASAWQAYAQGEYVGHQRTAHVPEYRLRVDDQLDLIYRVTREEQSQPYRLNVGDKIRVESFTDPALNRELILQPDGTITLRLLGQVRATGHTVAQLRQRLDKSYERYYRVPAITVTPLEVNTKLEDLRAAVDRRAGVGGQSQLVKVTPEGTVSLPALGSVPAQGLTLTELQHELNARYREEVEGIEVIPVLVERAPRYVYVLGEVAQPGRFELTGPTTVLQAIAMAGSWNVGARLKQVVVFRRGDDWRLLATIVDLHGALHGKQLCPAGEIWLSDSDVVIVPKSPILVADDFIELVFTRGIYGVFPVQAVINFSKLSTL